MLLDGRGAAARAEALGDLGPGAAGPELLDEVLEGVVLLGPARFRIGPASTSKKTTHDLLSRRRRASMASEKRTPGSRVHLGFFSPSRDFLGSAAPFLAFFGGSWSSLAMAVLVWFCFGCLGRAGGVARGRF